MSKVYTNPMKPELATVRGVRDLATGIKLLQVTLDDAAAMTRFVYEPGQFAEVSAFGVGESPFGIASTTARSEVIEFAVNRVGTVTQALHRLDVGDKVGVRGPLGNGFPLDEFKGHDAGRGSRSICRQCGHHHLWSTDHDQVRNAQSAEAWLRLGTELGHTGSQDEVRHWQVWALQPRRSVHLSGWPCISIRSS